jgi:hypothetical protein
MLSEISSIQNILREAIKQYNILNKKWLTEIINTVVDLQTQALQGSLAGEAFDLFSPPKKPNLSPIPSVKRLSTSSSNAN